MKTGIILLLLLLFTFFILLFFLLNPRKPSTEQMQPFYRKNFAHRGLHTKDKSIPENTLSAFQSAVHHGYGIELDIQFSKDFQIVVFHDNTLKRVCGMDGRVRDYTYEQLKTYSICNSNERIPLFSEVLELVRGKSPLIIELKTGSHNRMLCEKTYQMLKEYRGAYCVESFDPFILRWFKKHAKNILRGQLSTTPKALSKDLTRLQAFFLGNVLTNAIARPNFIAYEKLDAPMCVRISHALGGMRVVWTVKDCDNIRLLEQNNDAVIFEFYEPNTGYD